MNRRTSLIANIDWLSILFYTVLVFLGWINIYAAVYNEEHSSILDFSQRYGKQLVWIIVSFVLGFFILLTDSKFFSAFSLVIYTLTILALVGVALFGIESHGARSWFEIGPIRVQPSEFAKFATCLALAFVISRHNFKMMHLPDLLSVGLIIALPAALIMLQPDAGSALVYSSFIFLLYREGLHGSILLLCFISVTLFILSILHSFFIVTLVIFAGTLLAYYYYRNNTKEVLYITAFTAACWGLLHAINHGIAGDFSNDLLFPVAYLLTSLVGLYFIYQKKLKHVFILLLVSWMCIGASASVDYLFEHLQPHQKERILLLFGALEDNKKAGYNINQSKIAIGSGGLLGKGFLQGTQTRYNFVPEQETDFIFCTVGEEWGFVGSSAVILLFIAFILRILQLAERQRSVFSRVYGYGVACILFFHVAINIGMTIGLAPVIGIPLPFFSYGGSSLWSFSILIFIFLRLDANRLQVFR